jgi:phosphatidylinositol dimannoside acyltransferase
VSWARRFLVHGVFWRQLLRFAVLNVPLWSEPYIMLFWSMVFLLMWGAGRRGMMFNLKAVFPGSGTLANLLRTYRVFLNFAWTIADGVRFKEHRITPDWEFEGLEHFESLQAHDGGAIILTAHMGSYDVGANLFAEISNREIVMVRAPETDPQTRRFEEDLHERTVGDRVKIGFSTQSSELALDLLASVQAGNIIAIQGDRVMPGISTLTGTLFGLPTDFPAGPFALAMAARVPIYPLFIVRRGRRRYRLVVSKPIEVVRTRDRAEAFDRAVGEWARELEAVIRRGWYQWFAFYPVSKEVA